MYFLFLTIIILNYFLKTSLQMPHGMVLSSHKQEQFSIRVKTIQYMH